MAKFTRTITLAASADPYSKASVTLGVGDADTLQEVYSYIIKELKELPLLVDINRDVLRAMLPEKWYKILTEV